jgi:hypothetical protein
MTALSKQLEALQQKKAALREKETALQKQLKKQQQLERQRRHYLVGDAVLAQAAIDPEFANHLRDVLDRAVINPTDRELLTPIFPLYKNNASGDDAVSPSQAVIVNLHPAPDATATDQQSHSFETNFEQPQSA